MGYSDWLVVLVFYGLFDGYSYCNRLLGGYCARLLDIS